HVEDTMALVDRLKKDGCHVVSVEQAEKATQLNNYHPAKDKKQVFIFGNEVKGVAQNVVSASDEVLEIPQFGTKHSLNISVSVGVVIWDCWSKINA
ncbi:MAG: TrmH family RNA methyltransferase, partial [Maribacter sp.]|nr:TrmH family RNA methyltransferase [Maribacter sp.]